MYSFIGTTKTFSLMLQKQLEEDFDAVRSDREMPQFVLFDVLEVSQNGNEGWRLVMDFAYVVSMMMMYLDVVNSE